MPLRRAVGAGGRSSAGLWKQSRYDAQYRQSFQFLVMYDLWNPFKNINFTYMATRMGWRKKVNTKTVSSGLATCYNECLIKRISFIASM